MPRRTKLDRLPAALRAELERLLAERSHEGYVALAAWLGEQGYPMSHSAVWRADQRLQRTLDSIRASTEAARAIAQASPDQADEHSAAVIRLVQSQLFEALLSLREADGAAPADQVKLLAQAARAVADASRASIGNKRWQDEVRARLDAVERSAAGEGKRLDAGTLARIRDALYGG